MTGIAALESGFALLHYLIACTHSTSNFYGENAIPVKLIEIQHATYLFLLRVDTQFSRMHTWVVNNDDDWENFWRLVNFLWNHMHSKCNAWYDEPSFCKNLQENLHTKMRQGKLYSKNRVNFPKGYKTYAGENILLVSWDFLLRNIKAFACVQFMSVNCFWIWLGWNSQLQ